MVLLSQQISTTEEGVVGDAMASTPAGKSICARWSNWVAIPAICLVKLSRRKRMRAIRWRAGGTVSIAPANAAIYLLNSEDFIRGSENSRIVGVGFGATASVRKAGTVAIARHN